MKIALSFITIFLFIVTSNAQWQPISEDEYDKAIRYAVSATNSDFPLIFTVITSFIKDGKVMRKVTEVRENQARGYYRITRTILTDGQETNKYQMTYGFGNVFCSDDKVKWTNSQYECFGPVSFYPLRETESIEYKLVEKTLDGKPVKVYRKYTVFPPGKGGGKREFNEETATIDSRGFYKRRGYRRHPRSKNSYA